MAANYMNIIRLPCTIAITRFSLTSPQIFKIQHHQQCPNCKCHISTKKYSVTHVFKWIPEETVNDPCQAKRSVVYGLSSLVQKEMVGRNDIDGYSGTADFKILYLNLLLWFSCSRTLAELLSTCLAKFSILTSIFSYKSSRPDV